MDKQQFDHIENRIRQAAENISTPFNEGAWQKMEVLLDKELYKKRRRGFIWWWSGIFGLLALVTGLFVYVNHFRKSDKKISDYKQATTAGLSSIQESEIDSAKLMVKDGGILPGLVAKRTKKIAAGAGDPSVAIDPLVTAPGKLPVPSVQPRNLTSVYKPQSTNASVLVKTNPEIDGPMIAGKNRVPGKNIGGISTTLNNTRLPKSIIQEKLEKAMAAAIKTTRNLSLPNPTSGQSAADKGSTENLHTVADSIGEKLQDIRTESRKIPDTTSANRSIAVTVSKIRLTIDRRRYAPGLYFLASIASDASKVGKLNLDNRKAVFGVGIGYRISNRFSFQSGLYVGRRIYSAGPGEYKAAPNSYIGRYKVLKVDANCIIYELPLTVRYDVVAHKKFRAFTSAGFSSYIMKREYYKYHLTGSMGYLQKDSTYTSNKSFFSSAALSIGIEQRLFHTLFLQAEPYVRLPFSGVGEGKVRLYDAGLQLSLRYQPLWKRKK
ncbi:MAG: hypothetical protein WKF89_06435 [Chitinophagaceae bacterium]